jgi:hypothetical protein
VWLRAPAAMLARSSRVLEWGVCAMGRWHMACELEPVVAALSFRPRGPGVAHEGGTVTLLYCHWIG